MREDLKELTLTELCDQLVKTTEKLLKAAEQKAESDKLWRLRGEVQEIQSAIKEKQGRT